MRLNYVIKPNIVLEIKKKQQHQIRWDLMDKKRVSFNINDNENNHLYLVRKNK